MAQSFRWHVGKIAGMTIQSLFPELKKSGSIGVSLKVARLTKIRVNLIIPARHQFSYLLYRSTEWSALTRERMSLKMLVINKFRTVLKASIRRTIYTSGCLVWLGLSAGSVLADPTGTPTPTSTATETPTATITATVTPTATAEPTQTPVPTSTPSLPPAPTPFYTGKKLNFLIIIADDQRFDQIGEFMPLTQREIFDKGVQFSHAYITTPECCPSRSSMYTGRYASSHGVAQNSYPLLQKTLFDDLQRAGFYTGLVGKYLNSWDGTHRPEFTFWRSFPFGSAYFIDPIIYRNGHVVRERGYQLDVIRPDVMEFLQNASRRDQPFAMIYSPFSPHEPAIPAAQDKRLFSNLPPYRPPNYGVTRDKPRWVQRAGTLTRKKVQFMDKLRVNQLRSIQSLDRSVKGILDRLEQLNLADSTVVMYISDNGLLYGEFGLESKSCSYEPAIKVPFAVRLPGSVVPPRMEGRLVSNIDIAPTIRELAGLGDDSSADGQSLVPLLTNSASQWRKELLIEGFRNTETRAPFRSIHTESEVLIENGGDIDELYDLAVDPWQLNNLARTNPSTPLYADLKSRLNKLDDSIKTRAVVDVQRAARSQHSISLWKLGLRKCRLARAAGRKCNYHRMWQKVVHR